MTAKTSIDGAIMVDGIGIQGVPPVEYVAENDNAALADPTKAGQAVCRPMTGFIAGLTDDQKAAALAYRGPDTFPDPETVETTFAPLEQLRDFDETLSAFDVAKDHFGRQPVIHDGEGYLPRLGDFICLYGGTKFWPHDPRPSEVNIRAIAHSLSMKCRYGGHCKRSYSVGEHSVLIARWLRGQHSAETALIGLLHDAAEALSGFGDVQRPVKPYFVTGLEQRIWEGAIAPHFNLPKRIPKAVHDADRRITADELVNLDPMEWHSQYTDPLGVQLMYWSPAEAEAEFMNTFDALWEQVAIARAAQTLEVV